MVKSKYVEIESLSVRYGTNGITIWKNSSFITVKGCKIEHLYEKGILLEKAYGNCTFKKNYIFNVGDGIYLIEKPGDNNVITHNIISFCNYYQYNNNDGHAVGIQNSSNNLIANNDVSYCVDAIAIWSGQRKIAKNNKILYNRIKECNGSFEKAYQGKGIALGSADSEGVYHNRISYNIIQQCKYGIKLSVTEKKNLFNNNLVFNCGNGIVISRGADKGEFFNNILYKIQGTVIFSEHKRNGHFHKFDFNCYYPLKSNGFIHKSRVLSSFDKWRKISGQDTHSIIVDPRLKTNGAKIIGLQPHSPCIDAGVFIDNSNLDINRNIVPSGKAVDIGPFESDLFSYSQILK